MSEVFSQSPTQEVRYPAILQSEAAQNVLKQFENAPEEEKEIVRDALRHLLMIVEAEVALGRKQPEQTEEEVMAHMHMSHADSAEQAEVLAVFTQRLTQTP